jgi:3-oxoacyl-[acyl-carrier-protein] synthase-1
MNWAGESSASGLAVVTGMGAITSVGRTVTASCAAIRAKVSRPRKVTHMEVLDPDTQDLIPLTGHPVEGVTDGFLGPARWLRLAESALDDLLRTPGLPGPEERRFWARTGLVAVVPSPEDELFDFEGKDGLEGFLLDFVLPLREELELPLDERLVWMVGKGHAGAAAAVKLGLHELESARLDRVLVVAADSQLDPTALQFLAEENRLKTSEAPLGLQPGEAGACLLLERQASARQRGARPLALLSGVATGREKEDLFSGKPNPGIALAECIREVLDRTCPSSAFPGDVYLDLNGEQWRAHQWAMAQVRLNPRLGESEVHLPCVSLGDIGAASGALGACMAIHDLVRSHVRAGQALVLSSSHGGEVGCLSFHSAGG